MPSSPPRKRPIADFFRPYVASSVPTKRPSPSIEESGQKTPTGGVRSTTTPKAVKQSAHGPARTPSSSSVPSPLSAPGSRASLPIRSPHPKASRPPIDPPSTYSQAPRFDKDTRYPSSPTPVKPLSFSSLPSLTQAVVKDGEVIEIRDSDEEDSDSLKSLESLDDILGITRGGHLTSVSSSPEADEAKLEAERLKTLDLFTRGRSNASHNKEKLRALYARERAHQFNISDILNEHFDDEELEQKIKKSRADFHESVKATDVETNANIDKDLLAAVATTEDGEAGVSRLMNAVERTEALASNRVFLFFGVNGLNDWHDQSPVSFGFPDTAIPDQLWCPGDDEARSRAFSSGYMAELALKGRLSDEALNWIFQSVVLEREDDVRSAYIQCLQNASSSWTRTSLTPEDVQAVFQTLGADSASLQDAVPIQPRHRLLRTPSKRDPRYLIAALELFQSVCQDLDFMALSRLTSIVCRLAVDCELMSDGRVSSKVDGMLETLLSLPEPGLRCHVAESMIADVGHHLEDAVLQAHLLSHVPPTSTTASRVRILLAQSFLLGVVAIKDNKSLIPQISLDVLAEHVSTSASFDTRRRKGPHTLDYVALRARTYILDIAISDGGRPTTFPSRAQEVSFNRSVDHLADTIRSSFISIIDTGASHMTRTEAKDVLQALHWRLLYSVRTEVRPKKNIFDGTIGRTRDAEEVRVEEKGKDFMKQFLARKKEKQQAKVKENDLQSATSNEAFTTDVTVTSSEESPAPSETERLIRKQLELSE
ncbi:hypothetical protein A1O3_08321 [Capronia epimyces CBS 606.96]|uniref:Coiled-coil SMC6 And NSE5 INteracting (CANIN) domain-containing protein n=1 Tax=Capronia epimyces CBS 606.96 TaxID=1182542 RepID=W9XRS6_9EURO|nr:uncharacterized protein A1O3_08321 [Capronia epimyces CBS 606.96]EXJ80035.1 hypothetical protein A1O3_08321 [Capronia epimyces CBS 606.96]